MITHFRWEHRQKQRYYRVLLTQDLFGDWVVTRIWGGIDKANGRITHLYCDSYATGMKMIEKIAKLRISRGYTECLQVDP